MQARPASDGSGGLSTRGEADVFLGWHLGTCLDPVMQHPNICGRDAVAGGGHGSRGLIAKGHHLIDSAARRLAWDDPGVAANQFGQRMAVAEWRHGG